MLSASISGGPYHGLSYMAAWQHGTVRGVWCVVNKPMRRSLLHGSMAQCVMCGVWCVVSGEWCISQRVSRGLPLHGHLINHIKSSITSQRPGLCRHLACARHGACPAAMLGAILSAMPLGGCRCLKCNKKHAMCMRTIALMCMRTIALMCMRTIALI